MAGVLRDRRKQLLRHLLRIQGGRSVDELSRNLTVTRTASHQHVAA
jgi:predicted ArsR family transcriptional regulator